MAQIDTLDDLLETLEAAAERKLYRRKDFFEPYEKQKAFFCLGLTKRERLLSAGNQQGKTEAGAFEVSCHLTGEYPKWWKGRTWDRPVHGWAAGETSILTRNGPQTKLCGKFGVVEEFGRGFIPKSSFVEKPSLARGVTDAYDTVQVRHVSGGISTLGFKSYEQGREKFQSETLDFIWDDEEPPENIYSEELARIAATNGMIFTTFTPLKGMSSVVMRFLTEASPDRDHVTMTIEDALHIPVEERAKIIAGYKPHERNARVYGVPMLGSGRVFEVSDESIMCELPLERIPAYWVKLWGIDFGIDHPFAAILIVWDKDNDVIYIIHAIRVADQLPLQHSVPMKQAGAGVPVAWPQDGTQRRDDGKPLSDHYKRHGLRMLDAHATHIDGSISTEAGITEMYERMTTGRLKVSKHLADWFEEFRMYHRKDGLIVKQHDDLMSATRIAVTMRRYAKAVPLGNQRHRRRGEGIATDVDFDLD